ncbi:unnamed protein product [Bemisia tabaci]|uniref:Helicase POLQ-like n=1 Tax=Bemisia tabaci TaxID=7038 RepID=A0A9P0F334_BEMTA|nr:unnamed protein product [Bemisia tabaci]
MVSKNITEQLKANNGEKCAVRQEKSNVLRISEEFFGLPYKVKLLISKYKGIPDLYAWQKECLNLEAIKKRKNLIYALPTSGGKTLVAEILMFREMLIHEKNVIFILPYVSIVQEKVRALSPFGVELNFVVEEYAGGKGVFPPVKRRRKRIIYVATIEKASGLVNNLYETGRLEEEIGLIVIDELHLIGEPRGAILEATLTKIMYANLQIHIVGMSATIGNLLQLATFLNAEVFTHNFRPVELTEYVKCESQVYSITSDLEGKKLTPLRQVKLQPNDPDFVAGLVREVIPDYSCLVFCASKKNCENVALLICRTLNESFQEPKKDIRHALLRALAEEGNGDICKILKQTIPFGVAYHHSGLTIAERKLLEEAFCSNTICCICCTSTLAAGVNLPAKRVIIRSPYVGNKFITLSQYKQMIGRAGRAGFNEDGESFLLCQKNDALKIMTLLNSQINSCDSQLKETNAFPSLILSAVGLGLVSSPDDIKLFFNNTLFHAQNDLDADFDGFLEKSIKDLLDVGALQTKKHGDMSVYQLSDLGRGAVKANITIDDAKVLYADLKIALKCVSLSNYLHRLYLITPYSMACQIPINKDIYFNVYMALDTEELNVAKIIGIDDGCIMKFMSGRKSTDNVSHIMHRFYLTLILHKLWMNRNVWEVGSLFNIPRGLVHSLLTSAASFNSSVIRFCEELTQFSSIAVLLKEMSERLVHCCSAELLPLMELPSVKLGRAKQLLRAGYKNLQLIARSDVNSMVRAIDHLPKRVACQIIAAAKLLLLAKAELLQEEAEQVLEGLEGMKLY